MGLAGCFESEAGREAELRDRALELLPAQGHILPYRLCGCVELAASPSCARVVFSMPQRDAAARASLVRSEAVQAGWTVTDSDDALGGWSVFAKRGGFTAVAVLFHPEAYDIDCTSSPDPRLEKNRYCFNTLDIER